MKKNIFCLVFGLLILGYVVLSLNPEEVVGHLLRIRLEYFVLAAFVYLIHESLAGFLLSILMGSRVRLHRMILAHMLGMLYGYATPGRVGYYYTAFSIAKKTGTSRSRNIGLLTLYQGVNFFVKVFLCTLAVLYFSGFIMEIESQTYLFLVSVAPLILVFGIVLLLYTDWLNGVVGGVSVRLLGYLRLMQESCRGVGRGRVFRVTLLVFVGWFVMSLQWFLILVSLGVGVDFLMVLMLQPLLTTVMFIPISPGGLGVVEGGGALLFNLLGFGSESGAVFVLLVRFNSVLVDCLGLLDARR